MFLKVPQYCNLNTSYISIDDQQRYLENLKSLPEEWIWRNIDINYKTNSYGYRTLEPSNIQWNNYFASFGDSNVFGTGLQSDMLSNSVLSKLSGIEDVNLGVLGCSPQFITYSIAHFLENVIHLPKFILVAWPNVFRQSWFFEDEIYMWIPQHTHMESKYEKIDTMCVNRTFYLDHIKKEWHYYRSIVKQLCKGRGIKFIDFTFAWEYEHYNITDDLISTARIVNIDNNISKLDLINKYRARDFIEPAGGHYGIEYHREIANHLIKLI